MSKEDSRVSKKKQKPKKHGAKEYHLVSPMYKTNVIYIHLLRQSDYNIFKTSSCLYKYKTY